MHRAADGVYDGQQMAFSSEQAGVEILLANGGHGPCGPLDDFGRCASRYHELGCSHDQATDWLAQEGGPPRSTYAAGFASFAAGLNIDLASRAVWDDPDDADQPPQFMPARTVERPTSSRTTGAWTRPRPAGRHQQRLAGSAQAAGSAGLYREPLLAGMGVEMPAADRPSYPGVAQLRGTWA